MDLNARYAAAYTLLEDAVKHELSLLEKADHVTDLDARRALLIEYGNACSVAFARARALADIREEMLAQKPTSVFRRLFRKK